MARKRCVKKTMTDGMTSTLSNRFSIQLTGGGGVGRGIDKFLI